MSMAAPTGASHDWVAQLGPQDLQLVRLQLQPMTQIGGLAQRDLQTVARALALCVLIEDQPFMDGLCARLRRMVGDAVRSAEQEGRWDWFRRDVLAHLDRLEAIVSCARDLLVPHGADLLDGVGNVVRHVGDKARAAVEEHEVRRALDELARRAQDAPASTRLRRP